MSAPGVRVTEVRREYPVLGSTAGQLRDVIALLGPKRDGRTFVACTDWHVRWSYRRALGAGGFSPEAVEVTVDVVLVLPRWRPPPNATPALIATWEAEIETLVAHEEGHRDLAIAAGEAVARALREAPPEPSETALDTALRARAEAAIAEARDRELAYDEATAHGARWSAA